MKRFALATAFTALCALPAAAWDGAAAPVTAQVLPGWVTADGTYVAALHLKMAPGWKTYWRAPGDAGIPPSFDWSASRNLSGVSVSWPTPQIFDQNGMRSIGYSGDLVIPLYVSPTTSGQAVDLSVGMDLGVCSDVCVPWQLDMAATLDDTGGKPVPAIAAALAQRPLSAGEAGVTAATCRIEPTSDGLRVEARVSLPAAGGAEVVVLEPGVPGVWVSEAQIRRQGGDVIAVSEMIHARDGAFALDRSAIRITVLGGAHGVDIQGCTPG
ncbi:protein-disulfide reductase DsbD domain-containing protein [Roseobacter sp.]|uniref:protein-disulfide reductase DsbD domain-containing protein n=1 Tax=Roseobacter sp. TaxID=1907202 RepID=UPI0025FB8E28|nr:protein-disulfide reductase DsbD domain-containing protein [Roseobacter sp.]